MAHANTHVDPIAVGKRIRACRLSLDLTQAQIASSGVTKAHLSRIESGLRVPSLSAVIAIADRLHVSALYLLTGSVDSQCLLCGHEHGGRTNGKRK